MGVCISQKSNRRMLPKPLNNRYSKLINVNVKMALGKELSSLATQMSHFLICDLMSEFVYFI